MDKNEEYTNVFDDWISKGNRLLKIGDTAFLPIIDYEDENIYVCACDNIHTYSGVVIKQRFGEMISEKRTGIIMDKKMKHLSLHDFATNLIYWDSRAGMSIILVLFSFDQIDTGQLPKHILEELMIQKLSK